jgi:excinuclease ABC subunit B
VAATLTPEKLAAHIGNLEEEMYRAAEKLEFERAAELRDEIAALRQELVGFAG